MFWIGDTWSTYISVFRHYDCSYWRGSLQTAIQPFLSLHKFSSQIPCCHLCAYYKVALLVWTSFSSFSMYLSVTLSLMSQSKLSPWSCPDLWSELLSLSPHTPITTLLFRSPCTCYAHCCPWLRPIHPWCASSISSLPQIRAHYTCIFILLNSFPLFH